jgi:hypothetical protein
VVDERWWKKGGEMKEVNGRKAMKKRWSKEGRNVVDKG